MATDGVGDEGEGPPVISARVLVGAVGSGIASFVLVYLVRRWSGRLGLVDQPNERSSHVRPTPRGGGLGIVGGSCFGLLLVAGATERYGAAPWVVLAGAVVVAAVGLVDDVRGLSPCVRLVGQTCAGVLVVAATGPLLTFPLPAPLRWPVEVPLLGWILSVLWIVAVTNFFNFMDGIDGLAGGQAVASCAGAALAGWSESSSGLSAVVGASSLGFVFHNWAPARIFMGDVGSGFLGFSIASLPFLAAAPRRGDAVFAVAIGLALFLLDPVETLVRRARAGKRLTQAHREHRYQQLVAPGEAAGRVSGALVAAGTALSILGATSYRIPELGWLALTAAAVFFLVELSIGARRMSRVVAGSTTGV
jgi:UDP-N-acetylmuramyl pentapeptide phosphotransferase/UDP-N-acetylglucosamine-1-phosphate transferase